MQLQQACRWRFPKPVNPFRSPSIDDTSFEIYVAPWSAQYAACAAERIDALWSSSITRHCMIFSAAFSLSDRPS
jgi:hypothetical protein